MADLRFLAGLLTAFCIGACATARRAEKPVIDDLGCVVPAPTVFKKVGFSLEIAQATVGKTAVSGARVGSSPEIIALVSQASLDEQASRYLDCRARKAYPPEDAQWYALLDAFMKTRPTAEQLATWQKDHPSPAEIKRRDNVVSRQQTASRLAIGPSKDANLPRTSEPNSQRVPDLKWDYPMPAERIRDVTFKTIHFEPAAFFSEVACPRDYESFEMATPFADGNRLVFAREVRFSWRLNDAYSADSLTHIAAYMYRLADDGQIEKPVEFFYRALNAPTTARVKVPQEGGHYKVVFGVFSRSSIRSKRPVFFSHGCQFDLDGYTIRKTSL